MHKKIYSYNGKEYTLDELVESFPQVNKATLITRLSKNWTVAEAIDPSLREDYISAEYRGKELVVCFQRPIPVSDHMQPSRKKRYIATPYTEGKRGKIFYSVQIHGKPLIVYPGEFSILGIAHTCEHEECEPPYGGKECCELQEAGYCTGIWKEEAGASCQ